MFRFFVLILTRNNGTDPKKSARGIKKLSRGNTLGFSLLSSRLCTLKPAVSSALGAKRRLHRIKGAYGGLGDVGDTNNLILLQKFAVPARHLLGRRVPGLCLHALPHRARYIRGDGHDRRGQLHVPHGHDRQPHEWRLQGLRRRAVPGPRRQALRALPVGLDVARRDDSARKLPVPARHLFGRRQCPLNSCELGLECTRCHAGRITDKIGQASRIACHAAALI